ncbi:uncharacterized SAM-binding protein YcdF (DUF218 family) [Kaistia hirudinis]|uniref:Uncharacterized SAM-binding protein YcdF (DUF218 family) n=1 Tax=Kaistia hirudinis TaxID=1293440 RepID=A0A840AR96_9HYPH|nr:YdcF family protein [Kaistia hirudinis]MBB3931005.1 uncharacterized SAM-binding protein YcdF (DUF218 family) [Kaistia hirudinis]
MMSDSYVDRILALEVIEHETGTVPSPLPDRAAIIVFGHQLEPDGSMRPRLLQRLAVAHTLAAAHPEAPIVLTGGPLGTPRSEAEAMAGGLAEEGISADRLHLEPLAEDTVGNALLSVPILARLGVRHAQLVSSTYHVRRGLILLEAVARRAGLAIVFDHLAARDPALQTPRIGINAAEHELILSDLARARSLPLAAIDARASA